jgi:peptidoglycan pentaglycine glycine transferase (the first glycine)
LQVALTEITDKSQWETFEAMKNHGIFLQSFYQKELYETMGQKVWLYQMKREDREIRSLVTKVEAKRGTFFYLPYGPMLNTAEASELLGNFITLLVEKAKNEGASFLRMSPYWLDTNENQKLLRGISFRNAPIHMLAETLCLLDLKNRNEDELLAGMEKKHRNLIRRAEKDEVKIKKSTSSDAVERFIELHWETVHRHHFTPYPKDYFRKQVELFARDDHVQVVEAYWQDQLLASAIIMYYGKAAAYHHGASSSKPEHRKVPASYLLQWEAIKEAVRRNMNTYNFWGIAPFTLDENGKRNYENEKHPFAGITHFKMGFGGEKFELIPCQDYIINNKYYLNWSVESFRKWKRGF